MGVVGTALANHLYYNLLYWWGAGRSTTIAYVLPVVALGLGIVFLDEQLSMDLANGAGLILLGVILSNTNGLKLKFKNIKVRISN